MRIMPFAFIIAFLLLTGCSADEESELQEELYDSEAAAVENGLKTAEAAREGVIGRYPHGEETYYVYRIHQENAIGISKVIINQKGQYKWESYSPMYRFGPADPSVGYAVLYKPISEDTNIMLGQVLKEGVENVSIVGINKDDISYDQRSGFLSAILPKSMELYEVKLSGGE